MSGSHSIFADHQGPLVPFYFLALYNIILTVRSFIHMFFKDGGGHSIAGFPAMGNDVMSKNMVALFAQWGSSQLILAFIIWGVLLRYPDLTTFMLVACTFELLLRWLMAEGFKKRFYTSHTPPGAIGTKVMLPILLIMSWWSYSG